MKPEKNVQKKILPKITVDLASKLNEPKTIDLIRLKGFEFLCSTSDSMNLFEAMSLRILGDKTHALKLTQNFTRTLIGWYQNQSFPKEFEYLSKVKDFTEFYSCHPNHICFEGVNSLDQLQFVCSFFQNQNISVLFAQGKQHIPMHSLQFPGVSPGRVVIG